MVWSFQQTQDDRLRCRSLLWLLLSHSAPHFMVSVNDIPHMSILKLIWMKLLCPLLQSRKLTFSMATHPSPTFLPLICTYKLYSWIFLICRQSTLIRTVDGKEAEANSYSRLLLAWLCKSSVLSQHLQWRLEISTCGREHHHFSGMPSGEVFPFTRVTWQFPHFGFSPCLTDAHWSTFEYYTSRHTMTAAYICWVNLSKVDISGSCILVSQVRT